MLVQNFKCSRVTHQDGLLAYVAVCLWLLLSFSSYWLPLGLKSTFT